MDATSPVRVSVAGATTSLLLAVLTLPFGLVARLPPANAAPWNDATPVHDRYRDGSTTTPAAT
jgi:hypothetical protein